MTNFEKIKAMSVEEMVECFFNASEKIMLPPCNEKYCSCWTDGGTCKYVGKAECKQATKNWLESEVEGE